MQSRYDLINFYLDHSEDKQAAYEDLKTIADEMLKDSKMYALKLHDLVVEKMVEDNICPDCYVQLDIETWQEDRGEYQGVIAYETMGRRKCNSCGWIEEG